MDIDKDAGKLTDFHWFQLLTTLKFWFLFHFSPLTLSPLFALQIVFLIAVYTMLF